MEEHRESLDTGAFDFDEENENNKFLFEYRVKYDKVKTEALTLEARINSEKEEKARLEEEY